MEKSPTKEEIHYLEEFTVKALKNVYEKHLKLGSAGLTFVKKKNEGQYAGDMALRADIEAEKVVIESLQNEKLSALIKTEEHGLVNLSQNPDYFAVLDGLDGTGRYKAFMEGDTQARYGTMFGIFTGIDPDYNDYLVSAIMEHPTGRLFVSSRGNGAYLLNLRTGSKDQIKTSGNETFDRERKIIIDTYPGTSHLAFNTQTFVNKLPTGFHHIPPQTSAASYPDLASGKVDLVLECTRKGNLEIAVAYGLLKEAGGIIVDLYGQDLGNHKYLRFGQDKYIGVIGAASQSLALAASNHFRKN